jgi:hydrogenase maturation factor
MLLDWNIVSALNPYYTYKLLSTHHEGILILGAVFLCTTGAEALYSDLGHCGKQNIRISWIFVKTMLVLNYFGQGAWLIAHEGKTLTELDEKLARSFLGKLRKDAGDIVTIRALSDAVANDISDPIPWLTKATKSPSAVPERKPWN